MKNFSQHGFTLIEMIVSLAVFSIVITVSVGALLVLVATNEQLQGEQSVMTNLSFALDSMTREIRTGTSYYCGSAVGFGGTGNIFSDSTNLDIALADKVGNCSNGNSLGHRLQGIAFVEGGNSITDGADRILYYFDRDTGQIYRRVGGGAAQSIVSSGIFISDMEVFVTGSKPLSSGGASSEEQAVATIFIEAREINDPTEKTYQIQTTVTQRTLDI